MSIELVTVLLFGTLFLLFMAGMPIFLAMGVTCTLFVLLLLGPQKLLLIGYNMFGGAASMVLLAIPLFIFMGNLMRYTGMAQDLFDTIYAWIGGVRGGLAMGTIGICAVFASMSGVSSATTMTMGVIGLPAMAKHKYNDQLAIGTIAAGGLLGLIIPPSVSQVIYSSISGTSVGQMYFGCMIPGVLLAGLYIVYTGVRSYLQPGFAPAMPKEERLSWREKFLTLKAVVAPGLIVAFIWAGIYSGAITPTEAAGMGAMAVIIACLVKRTLNLAAVEEALSSTLKLSSMIMWLIMACGCFSALYQTLGAKELIEKMVLALPVNGTVVIIMMQVLIFILGALMDDVVVMMLCTPIMLPIVVALGFNPLWFGVLFMIQVQAAWLTPPYGFNLFYMRAIVPVTTPTTTIYKAVLPYIGIQLSLLVLVMCIPWFAIWLPSVVIR